jgi:hypothetical protein
MSGLLDKMGEAQAGWEEAKKILCVGARAGEREYSKTILLLFARAGSTKYIFFFV